jgi:dihydropyrimidinase
VLNQELPALFADGCTSFKVFMTYDDLVLSDRQLLEVFEVARREQALVMVHAEGYDNIRFLTERLEAAGKTAPYYHGPSRPQVIEREATHRAISHAELLDVPLMIVHVSGREAMEQIRWARQRGLKVYAETCPQYITLTEDDMKGLNMDMSGAKYVCSPPPRDTDSQKAIWEGLQQGVFQTFSSDHCPCSGRRGSPRAGSAPTISWRSPPPTMPRCMASIRRRARSRWAPTPTSCCGTRTGRRPSASPSCIMAPTTRPGRAFPSPDGR